MKKTVLLSIALITAGFLTATAQNDISIPKKYPGEKTIFESPNFETPSLPAIKKAKSGQVWWEPDTVYAISPVANESRIEERFTNKYNSHGLLTERIGQLRGVGPAYPDSSWINYLSYTYTYDSNNNVLTELEQNWKNNSWENAALITYTYNSNNNVLTYLQQIWNETSWVNSALITYTYDSNNNRLTYSYKHGEAIQLETYTYDSNNNMLTFLRQSWLNNSWRNISALIYTYDSNNNKLTQLQQSWNNNSWEDSFSSTYTYDSNNNLLTELMQRWKNNSWENSLLNIYTYNPNNNMLSNLYQEWSNNSWGNAALETYTYDSNNNLLSELWQYWVNNSWENNRQYLMTYDENSNGTSVESWRWGGGKWYLYDNRTTGNLLYYNNMQSNFWHACHKITASYINVTDLSAIKEPPASPELNAISIYPNPTRGELRITNYKLRITDIQVFDRTGVQVLHTQQTALDISHLPAGIYFVQIKTEKGTVTKKLVKL